MIYRQYYILINLKNFTIMRKKLTLMFVALFAIAAFAATQVLNQATRRAAVSFDVPDGTELSAFIQSVIAENPAVEAYVFNLAANASYTLSAPIEVGKSISIIGDAENPATIDASAVKGDNAIIKMTAVADKTVLDGISFANLNMKIATRLFYANKQKYWVKELAVNNCVIAVDGTFKKSIFDCNSGGNVSHLLVNKSTIYANPKVGQNGGFFSSQSSQKPTEFGDNETQTFEITNSTLYNITNGNDMCTLREKDKEYMIFIIKDNIIVNCGKNKQFFKGFAGASDAKKATWEVDKNTIFWGGVDVSKDETIKATNEEVKNCLPTDPGFADPENGDFTIGAGTAQAKEQTGDPRWLVEYDETKKPGKDITISPADGADISAAIEAEKPEAGDPYFAGAGNITVNLAAGASYTVSAPIEGGANITINGAEGAVIDASANDGAFIQMSANPVAEAVNDCYLIDNVTIKDVTINGVNSYFIDSPSGIRYVVRDLTVDNAIMKLATTSATTALIRLNNNQSGVKDFTIKNSTFYQTGASNVQYFVQYSQGDPARWKLDAEETWSFNYYNNTFYKVGTGNWANTSRTNNVKARTIFNVEKNIWVDCGNGQIAQRMVNQQKGFKTTNFVNNTYWKDGKAIDQTTYTNGEVALETDPEFKDAANGDFTIGKRTHQNLYQTGDPRWLKDTEDYIAPQVGVSGTAAIDLTVPANLGKMDGTNGPTDLALFLDSYLQNSPNPAYIKLTLEPGAKYTISKPLTTMTAITIVGDESNPALIDASSLTGSFVEADELYAAGDPNANDFLTSIYNVELKNFIVVKGTGSLFSSKGQKYDIPNMTIDNVVYGSNGCSSDIIDFKGGGVAENVSMTRTTIYAFGDLYGATGGSTLAEAGVNSQKFTFSYNTLLCTKGLTHADDSESAKRTINVDHNVIIAALSATTGFVEGLNAGDANCIVQYNAFQKIGSANDNDNLVFDDISDTEDAAGAAGSIKGSLVWLNPKNFVFDVILESILNFPVGDCPQRDAKIGDPRWLSAKMRIKEADIDDDNDLAKVINEGVTRGYSEFELVQNEYGNLRYTVKQSIVADKALVITGKNVTIDVAHSDPFILLSKTPAVGFMPKASAAAPALNRAAVEYTDYYAIDALSLSGLKINGLKNSIIYDNNTKYCVVDLTIDDCVLGLETEAVKNEALISFQAGGVKDFTIKNSTVYGNNAVAKYFIRYNNSARLDRYGFDKNTEFQTMTYQNNTFYGLLKSDGQWGNYSGIAGQNYSKFVVEKNIWYNCGKDIIRRLSGGRFGGNAPRTFDKNTYFNEGADISDAEGSYDNSDTALTTDPGFKKPAEGDFTLSAYSAQCNEQTGDPGGHYNPVTGIETVKTAEETSLENAVIYNLNGQRIDKAQAKSGVFIVNGKKVVIK